MREDPTRHRPGRPPLRRGRARRCATAVAPDLRSSSVRRRRADDLALASSRVKPASSPRWRPPPTTSPCFGPTSRQHRRPEDHARTSTATSSRSTTPSADTCWGSSPTTWSPAPRRSRSPSASACSSSSPCAPVPAPLLTESATPAQLADLVAEHGVTVLATAPTAYKQILDAGKARAARAGCGSAVSAGEHMPISTWERIRDELGLRVIDGIGGDRDAAHLHLGRRRRHPPRGHRQARARLPRHHPRTPTARRSARVSRAGSPSSGPSAAATSTTSARAATSSTAGTSPATPSSAGRGRLLLLPRAHRQHDRLLRLQHRRPRGRGGDRHAPRRRRVGGRRQARPAPRLPRLRLRRAARRRRRRRGQGQGDPGPRQAHAGAVQVPARGPLRRRAAPQHQRQAAALRAAPAGRGKKPPGQHANREEDGR